MSDEAVVIVPYDASWPSKFEKEKDLLQKALGSWVTGGIHHIGSTAIEGLSAKPIIDILVGVESLEASRPCIEILKQYNYQYFPYKAESEHWFCKPSPEHRTHHLHIIATSHPDFKARLAFRDYLRSHVEERNAYEHLKLELAKQYRNDREAYTQAKALFVSEIVKRALLQ